jgi:hypothetical protein
MLENTKKILQISTVEERERKNEMFDTVVNEHCRTRCAVLCPILHI